MSTNYQKIKLSKEVTEYRDAVDLELSDATHISNGGSNYGSKTGIFT